MATRIRVRRGDTEVEYEGSEQFLKTELASLLQAASTFPAGSDRQAGAAAADTASPEEASSRTSGRKTPTRSRKTPTGKSSATRASAGETSGGKHAGRKASAVESASPADGRASGGPDAMTPAASPTADIAGKIGCKHGTDLVLAASARLNLGAGQRSFSRAALLGEMKTAKAVLPAGLRQELEPIPAEPDQGTAAQRAAPGQLRPDRAGPKRAGEDSGGVAHRHPIASTPSSRPEAPGP